MRIKAKTSIRIDKKKLFLDYLPMAATAVLIIVSAIVGKQSFIKTLPTLVTLFVQIMLSRANRYAFLVGGTNSLLYTIAPLSEGLYFSVVSGIAISAPIQFFSFFNWNRKKHKGNSNKTELKVLNRWSRPLIIVITVAVWLPCYMLLRKFFDGPLGLLDSFAFIWGITTSLLSAFRYVDSQYFSVFGCVVSLAMWMIVCVESPNNLNYLVISFYNVFMVVKAAVNWTKQYLSDKVGSN